MVAVVDYLVITNWKRKRSWPTLLVYFLYISFVLIDPRWKTICLWLNLLHVVKLLNYDFIVETDTDFYRNRFIFNCL
jgi:hypothetical protein